MKEVKHYICDVCGTEYAEKEKAIECEKGHRGPVKISSAKYLSLVQDRQGYPTQITVEMSDGKSLVYKR